MNVPTTAAARHARVAMHTCTWVPTTKILSPRDVLKLERTKNAFYNSPVVIYPERLTATRNSSPFALQRQATALEHDKVAY